MWECSRMKCLPNECALLSCLFAQIGSWHREDAIDACWPQCPRLWYGSASYLVVSTWKMQLPNKNHFATGKDWATKEAFQDVYFCDTYVGGEEQLRETTYSLTNLALTQRTEFEPVDIPQWFDESKMTLQLTQYILNNAYSSCSISCWNIRFFHWQCSLHTCIVWSIWLYTFGCILLVENVLNMPNSTKYLLLDEFHQIKYLASEKEKRGKRSKTPIQEVIDDW